MWVIDAGFPAPLCNRPVFDLYGNLLGYPACSIRWPESSASQRVDHLEVHRRSLMGRGSEARFRDHGLEYFDLVGGDLLDIPRVVRRMSSTRARARFLPPEQRQWTLATPAWWRAG